MLRQAMNNKYKETELNPFEDTEKILMSSLENIIDVFEKEVLVLKGLLDVGALSSEDFLKKIITVLEGETPLSARAIAGGNVQFDLTLSVKHINEEEEEK